jgi:hypothetical protein
VKEYVFIFRIWLPSSQGCRKKTSLLVAAGFLGGRRFLHAAPCGFNTE